jgi:hypothetical protein
MNHNLFFLETLTDIREKLASNSKYHSIRACGLLRQLILDGGNLIDLVKRPYKMKVYYTVGHLGFIENGFIRTNMVVFWKPFLPVTKAYTVSKDEFLAIKVLKTEHHLFSVRDIIHVTANVSGGVHMSTPSDDKEKKYDELIKEIDNAIPSIDTTHLTIDAICVIVLAALQPLEEIIKQDNSRGGI